MPLGKIESFDINDQNWDTYVRRVKQFIALNEVKETLHVSTLVTLVGPQCYDLMCDLCAPDLPEDKSWAVLVKLIKDHLEPERSEIAERHRARQAAPAQGGAATAAPAARQLCSRCGKPGHVPGRCRYRFYSCDKCGEKGHLKATCKNNDGNGAAKKGQYFLDDTDSDDDHHFYNLVSNNGDKPYYIRLSVENVQCKFEIDTGSKISAISKKFYGLHFSQIPIQSRTLTFRSYTGDVIETLGYIVVRVKGVSEAANMKLYVIDNGGPPLLGRIWIKHLKLSLFKNDNGMIYNVAKVDSMANTLRSEFPEVFAEGLGREPAVAMFGRRLRGRLDLLRADPGETVRDAQLQQEERAAAARPLRVVAPGDPVLTRDYSARGQKWTDGVVVERSGPVSYKVKTMDGRVHKRHVDQLLANRSVKSRFSLSNVYQGSDCELGDAGSDSRGDKGLSSHSHADAGVVDSPRITTPSPATSAPDSPVAVAPQTSPPPSVTQTRRRAALRLVEKMKNYK
ncbi:Uncharacterized protein OBRU01_02927 [Operophtera brumata]|uniref:CCHC-type domain-containing protein n=1 Tax=Operophtera brumata TaxID=104452 RepID=A0A0L7LR53_OPEBR|nr:Uncharacterized protein OBRU01_02927 [Operophtera brumata]